MNREIIVIGGNHHNTLSILRSLGERGIKPLLIVVSSDPNPYIRYSKYVKRYQVIDNVNSIAASMYALHTSTEKAVVIACSDAISSYLDLHYNKLSQKFILPGSIEEGRITNLMNKNTMQRLAVESGINVPEPWMVSVKNPCIDTISYPCIVKPLISKNGSKSDIVICEHEQELKDYLSHCRCEELQIQEYITKDIEF